MKKIGLLLVIMCIIVSFSGCGKKVYKKDAKDFSIDGFTITLTEAFEKKSYEGYTVCYDSSSVAVFVLKETYELKGNFKNLTLDEYADLLYASNSEKFKTGVVREDGLTYLEHEFYNEEEKCTYKYFSAMYKGSDAFWLVQFACDIDKYDEHRPYFIKWAKTVKLLSNNNDSDLEVELALPSRAA